jgi:cell fate regulator YaaT (PSP1 superfamily)
VAAAPVPEAAAAQAPEAASATPTAERWGDDSDAPTPVVQLAPSLPVEAVDPDGEDVWGDSEPPAEPGVVTNVVGVTFHSAGKIYELDAGDASYVRGDQVLVESDRGPALATVAIATLREQIAQPLRRVLRRADDGDVAAAARLADRGRQALRVAKERARARSLPIKVFRIELSSTGNKALVYFSSEDRVDFRELVRDLTQELRARVEMRQTGVRDEAKLVGGIGSCGRELCCTTFLPHFDPVSIRMAKDQGLVLNPTKVSGQCGRLKCCLVYEQATYQEMRKGLPKLGKRVVTPAGEGRVTEVDVLRRRIRVSFEPGEFQTFPADAVTAVAAPAPGKPEP